MSEIEMKIKEKTKELDECKEMLVHSLKNHLEQGVEAANAMEIGTVADSIKDLAEATEKCVKSMYQQQLMEAMSKSEYGEDYDEEGPLKGYRGRSATTGRFVHRGYEEKMMNNRDMDRGYGRIYYPDGSVNQDEYNKGYEEGHRMGYEEGHNRGYQEGVNRGYREAGSGSNSRYENSRRGFDEAHKEGSNTDHEDKMQATQEMLNTITEELQPKIMKMNPQEKQLTKNTLQSMINRI